MPKRKRHPNIKWSSAAVKQDRHLRGCTRCHAAPCRCVARQSDIVEVWRSEIDRTGGLAISNIPNTD